MSKDSDGKLSSTILGRINSARMSEVERQTASNAMRNAFLLVDGFAWVAKKIEQLGQHSFLKPSLRH